MKIINCLQCNSSYESRYSTTKFCSDKCRSAYNWKHRGHERICGNCNKKFNSYQDNTYCSDDCREFVLNEKRKFNEAKQKEIALKKSIKKLIKVISNVKNKIRICTSCGNEYHRLKGINGNKFCGEECIEKYYKEYRKVYARNNELDKDKRLSKNGKIDYSINLKDLYDRDKGICHICNEATDYQDFIETEENYFIAGNNYPSIDHVIPINKGGLHQWDNIKIAHRVCNSRKGDKIILK